MERTLLVNGRILDCTGDEQSPFDGDVLVEDDRIREVRRGRIQPPPSCRVVDVHGATIMPGLGDAHVHFGQPLDFEFDYLAAATAPPEDAALSTAAVARQYIEHGVTTCVSGGNAIARGDVALKNVIDRGWLPGPRILAGSELISDPDGIPSTVMPTSAREMRDVVARQCDLGADVIKVFLSGENVMPPGAPVVPVEQTFMSDELVEAAVVEADRHGAFVNAHARGAGSVALATRQGVRLISHASYVDDEGLALLQERDDVWICPGVHYLWAMPNLAPEPYATLATEGGYPQEYDDALKTIRRLADAGVPLLAGGDYGHVWQPHGGAARDLQHFVDGAGVTAYEAIVAGTRQFGGLTRLPIGQLAPGFFADMLVVEGDPTADISILTDPSRRRAVVKGGEVVWASGLER